MFYYDNFRFVYNVQFRSVVPRDFVECLLSWCQASYHAHPMECAFAVDCQNIMISIVTVSYQTDLLQIYKPGLSLDNSKDALRFQTRLTPPARHPPNCAWLGTGITTGTAIII